MTGAYGMNQGTLRRTSKSMDRIWWQPIWVTASREGHAPAEILHPKIHGGILARRHVPAHVGAIKDANIHPEFDLVLHLPMRQTRCQECRSDAHRISGKSRQVSPGDGHRWRRSFSKLSCPGHGLFSSLVMNGRMRMRCRHVPRSLGCPAAYVAPSRHGLLFVV